MPENKSNPTPGKLYLRHIGFLGAAPPSIKGLKDYAFADGGRDFAEFAGPDKMRWGFGALADLFRGLRERMIETDGLDKADKTIPDYQIEQLRTAAEPDVLDAPDAASMTSGYSDHSASADRSQEDPMMDKAAELAARETELASKNASLESREKKIRDAEAATARIEATSYADSLVTAGKILPRQKPGIVELLLVLPVDTPLNFAEGNGTVEKPAATVLREFLDSSPRRFDFREKSNGADDRVEHANFAAPEGFTVNGEQLELHARAKAYQADHPNVSFIEAAKRVGAR